ncbi:hypothetical protein AMTRI_Chr13g83930 [Amborella trichopoda]|uniref:Uncharacterized protein n=1 Tax=Amborella trichopoda TaxID=13333 RepID=W1NZH9_AMBTC|nr:uncharacterized protein LOC18428765 [Amborella trichopoda]ERN00696.1 hypothetical protein AMTR_s00106p00069950 [Amborella trichopoda]|eukprot:XP_006838127.1 uncharacterized protein LOC18428765 [Amborella trichopoda]
MEEASAAALESITMEDASHSNHGWQKVVYPKRHRKQALKDQQNQHPVSDLNKIKSNGNESNVFRSVEQQAEERRRRVVEAQRANAIAELPVKKDRLSFSSDDESDEEGVKNNGVSNGEEKKEKVKKPKKPKVTVSEAASKIDAGDLSVFLADVSASYETQPDIQLMRFADYFGRAFAPVSASQFPWTKLFKESSVSKIIDIPLCHIPDDVYKTSVDWIGKRNADALGEFALWALDNILTDVGAQQGGLKNAKKLTQQPSYRAQVAMFVVLSMVLRKKPDILVNLLSTLKTNAKYQGQDKLLLTIWIVGQACQGDLVVGMLLWVQLLLPMTLGKSSNPLSRDLVLQLLERIFAYPKARPILVNGAVRKGERLVPPPVLESLWLVTFPAPSARIKATERFEAVYPSLKEVALAGSWGNKWVTRTAEQLLPNALAAIDDSNQALSDEAIDIFLWCLRNSYRCYKQWEDLYLDHIYGSITILHKLSEKWGDTSFKLWEGESEKKVALERLGLALTAMRVKNQLALKGEAEYDGDDAPIRSAEKYCSVLMRRLPRSRGGCVKGCLKGGVFFLTLGVAVYAAIASPYLESLDWKKVSVMFGSPQSF